jgi:hypothetical protein
MKRTFVTAIAVAGFAFAAYAQQSPPPDTAPPPAPPPATAPSGPPPAAAPSGPPPAAAAVPEPNTKPVDCRARAREKGLRGPAVRDEVTICREEQRLACVKEAVERKIAGEARREFIRKCSNPGGGGGRGRRERNDG